MTGLFLLHSFVECTAVDGMSAFEWAPVFYALFVFMTKERTAHVFSCYNYIWLLWKSEKNLAASAKVPLEMKLSVCAYYC